MACMYGDWTHSLAILDIDILTKKKTCTILANNSGCYRISRIILSVKKEIK